MTYPQEPGQPGGYGQQPGGQPGEFEQPGAYGQFEGYAPASSVGEYAHWGLRVGSYLIDALILLPFYIVAGIAEAAGAPDPADPQGEPAGWSIAVVAIFYLAALGVAIWNLFIRQGRTGQSVGKSALKTKLVWEKDGQPIGAGYAFLRQLAHILDGLPCYLGYLWPLWDAKKQTFADKILKTVVVKV